jgi:hypothetical protein
MVLYASYVCLLHVNLIENHPIDLEVTDPSFLRWFCHNDLLGIILEIYIDDVVVKLDNMDSHLADLWLALQRMHRYWLKMNLLKCVFHVLAGKFFGFIIHENDIEIDLKKIESIKKGLAATN